MDDWILIGLGVIVLLFVISLIYFVVSTDDYDGTVNDKKWWKWSYYFPIEKKVEAEDDESE